jgi:phosphoketolase
MKSKKKLKIKLHIIKKSINQAMASNNIINQINKLTGDKTLLIQSWMIRYEEAVGFVCDLEDENKTLKKEIADLKKENEGRKEHLKKVQGYCREYQNEIADLKNEETDDETEEEDYETAYEGTNESVLLEDGNGLAYASDYEALAQFYKQNNLIK